MMSEKLLDSWKQKEFTLSKHQTSIRMRADVEARINRLVKKSNATKTTIINDLLLYALDSLQQ